MSEQDIIYHNLTDWLEEPISSLEIVKNLLKPDSVIKAIEFAW